MFLVSNFPERVYSPGGSPGQRSNDESSLIQGDEHSVDCKVSVTLGCHGKGLVSAFTSTYQIGRQVPASSVSSLEGQVQEVL